MKKVFLFILICIFSNITLADSRKSFEWNLKDCQTNKVADSCSVAAFEYYRGKEVRQDYKKAAELFKVSCDRGNLYSCNWLGNLYLEGHGVPKSPTAAISIYEMTCEKSFLRSVANCPGCDSCESLGRIYEEGIGVPKNKMTAKEYYGLGCDRKLESSCDSYKRLNK